MSFFIAAGKHHHLHVAGTRMANTHIKRKLSETLTVFLCVTGISSLHLSALLKPTSSVYTAIISGMCLQIAFPSPYIPLPSLDANHLAPELPSRRNNFPPTMRGIKDPTSWGWQPNHSYCLKLSSRPKLNLSVCIRTLITLR